MVLPAGGETTYYGRALNRYSRDFTTAADNPSHSMGRTKPDDAL